MLSSGLLAAFDLIIASFNSKEQNSILQIFALSLRS